MKIVLNAIVKNEAHIIERMLSSVAPFISSYCIGDTGSTDRTPDIIRAFFNARCIDGVVFDLPFENFGQARTDTLQRCREMNGIVWQNQAVAEGHRRAWDYVLFMDADHEFQGVDGPVVDLGRLEGSVYSFLITSPGLEYYLPRLLRHDIPARFVGATHECLATDPPTVPTRLNGPTIRDHADGGCRAGKFERDIRLLLDDLARDPENPRTVLYLANSLRDAGRPGEALPWYSRRIEMGGWDEEVWYATYQRAICYQRLGSHELFVHAAWEAYAKRISRAEPLWALANHYKQTGQHDLACAVAELGRTIPVPTGDVLFVETSLYGSGFDEILTVSGYYAEAPGRKEAARAALARLLDLPPGPRRDWAERNQVFYSDPRAAATV